MPPISLFLAGDVMLGRGIDQILPHPAAPALHERWMSDARDYVNLAEARHGAIPRAVPFHYVWGAALAELAVRRPTARIVNLETSVTASERYEPGKAVHYRMHPRNLPCLGAAGIDCCVLANNHVLDWGREGLLETLDALERAGIARAGAGRDRAAATRPAVLPLPGGDRLLVFACGLPSSGAPAQWAAAPARPGIYWLADLADERVGEIADLVARWRRPGDIVLLSVHWGGNWGYQIDAAQRAFAHGVIDRAQVDVLHGHSSHHPLAVEIHRERLVIYGCGDLLNDYEGIGGYEAFRSDLVFLYLPVLREDGTLQALDLVPLQVHRFRLQRCSGADADWLAQRLAEQSRPLGARVERLPGAMRVTGI